MKREFEVMRHAEKTSEGNISEQGKLDIIEKAKEYFKEIENYSDGTVISFMPSNVGRTQETRDIFEEELKKLLSKNSDKYQIIDVNNLEDIKKINKDETKKTLIVGLGQSTLIGFSLKKNDKAGEEFVRRKDDFKGDEDLIGKLWAAKPEELEDIKREIEEKYKDVNLGDIKPSNFHTTPEEVAKSQLQWTMRMLKIINKHFPENEVKLFGVSHNISTDFLSMKLLGKSISASTINEWGGKVRQYLESHKLDIDGEKIKFLYRGEERELDESLLDSILKELDEESKNRKKMWKEKNI